MATKTQTTRGATSTTGESVRPSEDGQANVSPRGRTEEHAASGAHPLAGTHTGGNAHAHADGRSVGTLLRELTREGRTLIEQEVELAKTEISEKLDTFQQNTVQAVIGGVIALGGLMALLWAINMGLTALLAEVLSAEVAVWLSPLILAAVFGIVGYSMINNATNSMKEEGISPRRTTRTLKDDKEWVQQKAR